MKKILSFSLMFILLVSLFCIPINTEAETLRDYQNKLKQVQTELANNQAAINKTDSLINSNKAEINNITQEFKNMGIEVRQMQADIITYNLEIKDKSLETKQLFEYLQLANGENAYLEYAFGAETITDFIYRMSVVEQLTEYNEKTIDNLEKLIEKNKKREKDLAIKEKDLQAKQVSLEKRIETLTGQKSSLSDLSMGKKEEVRVQKEYVDYLVKQGCKTNDVIGRDCAVTGTAGIFMRPVVTGYVTSEFGYRWGSFHRALDISNRDPYNTKLYPVANGVISAKYTDPAGALVLVIEHRTINGNYYSSLYAHMSRYAPNLYVGKSVTTSDYIGYIGATGNAQGPHVHMEIAPCRLFNLSDSNCGRWDNYVSFLRRQYDTGRFKGPRDLINFPKLGVTFYNR
ncbi:MAG: peptidoglycan DD-metalloendopeptidase family protein [Bacilli bacterium]